MRRPLLRWTTLQLLDDSSLDPGAEDAQAGAWQEIVREAAIKAADAVA